MRTISQLMLTFLINACWQIPVLTITATFAAWLLKDSSARYRHWLWTVTLMLSLAIPVLGAAPILLKQEEPLTQSIGAPLNGGVAENLADPLPSSLPVEGSSNWSFQLNQNLVIGFFVFYCLMVLYRSFSLANAGRATFRIRRNAIELDTTRNIARIIEHCKQAIGDHVREVEIVQSDLVYVPVTFGVFRPVIVLPTRLVHEGSDELLMSAMGHEIVHVARRDYLLNLFYEVLYLPLSFNPAASLIRRRIKQTRELCCDEIVAQRILRADAYARSLVKLASSAPPLIRLSVSTTVGIADADILEARIMSLLRKPNLTPRRKVLLSILSVLLLVPCLAAASFAMRFDVNAGKGTAGSQDPAQEQEQKEKAEKDKEQRERERTREIRMRTSEGEGRAFTMLDETDPRVREEIERKRELEMEMREKTHAALVRLARITMEEAIQVATSQSPGKVLECSLIGERWEEPGKLARDGLVLYHVVIMSGDESSPGATHVLVNAVDGSVYKVEKELPRKIRSAEPR